MTPRTAVAGGDRRRAASSSRTDDPDTIILRLSNGTLVHDDKGFAGAARAELFHP
jgi:hypothetical protein